jgi:hypothetical protein
MCDVIKEMKLFYILTSAIDPSSIRAFLLSLLESAYKGPSLDINAQLIEVDLL